MPGEINPRQVQQEKRKSWQEHPANSSRKDDKDKRQMMIMMLGHDGQEGREVGGERKNVLFSKYSFALQKL